MAVTDLVLDLLIYLLVSTNHLPTYLLTYLYLCMLSCFSHVQVFVTLWTIACQAPLFMGFSRQEYWSALPFPPPLDLPDPGIEPLSPVSSALTSRFFTTEPSGKTLFIGTFTKQAVLSFTTSRCQQLSSTGPKFDSVTTAHVILTLCGEVAVNSVLDAWQVESYLI